MSETNGERSIHALVEEWGAEKDLHSDPGAQLVKLEEELWEMAAAHAGAMYCMGYGHVKPEEMLKDAIGDSLVVLHQFCPGHALDFEECLHYPLDYEVSHDEGTEAMFDRVGKAIGELHRAHEQVTVSRREGWDDGPELQRAVGDLVEYLRDVAAFHDLTLLECLEHAWEEVSDREGETVGGIFKKREDL